MTDLDIAKNKLCEEDLSLAIVKNGEVLFETKSHRISGFMEAIENLGSNIEGSSLADKVAGKAIALLCVFAKIKEVYAKVLSRKAQVILKQHNIIHHCGEIVDNILDQNKNSMCPFEEAAATLSSPQEAYAAFRILLKGLKTCK
jgi:hypothetical protein